ncbi:NifU family protein [Micromonospora sp. DR5-3]|uniref:NifU family protein n=1 Tax=unclassified Micromonospora TaxID=2617518 RepID=UPI0011DA00E2|nr:MULTISPECIES: NifU family protein [unclassified Micromonospora]MCW3818545.1 NifU family protein [Micromonospora sp. DR5-3]TYC20283.1 NifU family protein [Micromonospora sp. MP36]
MAEQPELPRLDDAAVEPRLARLDAVLGQLEQTPGRTAELALEAVELLTEVYGEALARVTDLADSPGALDRLTGDELLRHLLLLHRIHPDPVERRVARAIDDLRPQLRAQGADVALMGVRGEVARISLSARSCGGGGAAVRELVREQVLTFAPELSTVDVVAPEPAPALIPIATLWQRPDRTGAAALTEAGRAAGPAASGGRA